MYSEQTLELYKQNLITELEYKVLCSIVDYKNKTIYEWYDCSDNITFNSICDETNINWESLKGVLGSLIKKGYITEETTNEAIWINTTPLLYGVRTKEEFKKIFE